MRVAYMSDLHREFWPPDGGRRSKLHVQAPPVPFGPHGPDLSVLRGRCDALVIPGDFDLGTKGAAALVAASDHLDVPVIYVPGNHEFYGGKIYKVLRGLRAALEGTRVHLLDRGELVLWRDGEGKWRSETSDHLANPDCVRILGTTLWTDFAALGEGRVGNCLATAQISSNDYKRITVGPEDTGHSNWRKLSPRDTLGFHLRDRRWLVDRLAEPFPGRTIVVTHMAPSMRSVPEADKGLPVVATYGSHLEALIEEAQPDLWIHGHTHTSSDYAIGRTRVVCNPYGYWGHELNVEFDAGKVVDLAVKPSMKLEM